MRAIEAPQQRGAAERVIACLQVGDRLLCKDEFAGLQHADSAVTAVDLLRPRPKPAAPYARQRCAFPGQVLILQVMKQVVVDAVCPWANRVRRRDLAGLREDDAQRPVEVDIVYRHKDSRAGKDVYYGMRL
jgi:hypothetical protein